MAKKEFRRRRAEPAQVELQGKQGEESKKRNTQHQKLEEKMELKDSGSYQLPNNESSSCLLLSSTQGIFVTVLDKDLDEESMMH